VDHLGPAESGEAGQPLLHLGPVVEVEVPSGADMAALDALDRTSGASIAREIR
jgi:hypothetical protein